MNNPECHCYIHSGCPIHSAPESPAKEQPGEQKEELISKIFRAFGITDYPMNRKMMRQLVAEAEQIAATPPPPERP